MYKDCRSIYDAIYLYEFKIYDIYDVYNAHLLKWNKNPQPIPSISYLSLDVDLEYIRKVMPPNTDVGFFDYLAELDTSGVVVYAIDEGMVVFPKIPLLRIEGPLAVVQLLETTLLNLINYARLL